TGVGTANGLGANTALRIAQGGATAVTSTYNLTGGTLTATLSDLLVGDGTGILNVSGSSTVATLQGLGESSATPGTSGTVNHARGTLQIGSSGIYAGTVNGYQLLNLAGGTLRTTANDSITVPIKLNGPGLIDTQAFNVTSSGNILGAGSLAKLGSGSLRLGG